MRKLKIKPLSVNEAYTGKRYKTEKYKRYAFAVLLSLPKIKLPEPPFKVYYEFGFSSKSADLDNPVKPFQDLLQKKYGFDDKLIYEMHVKRVQVPKGEEYVKFAFMPYLDKKK